MEKINEIANALFGEKTTKGKNFIYSVMEITALDKMAAFRRMRMKLFLQFPYS